MSYRFALGVMFWVLWMLHFMFYMACGCIVEEKIALMQIRSSLAEAMYNVPASWSWSYDCCSWERVVCNNSSRVSHLDLSQMTYVSECRNLNLTIFSSFHELQLLDLNGNFVCLLNHDGLQGLTKLRYLDLSNNYFLGNDTAGSPCDLKTVSVNDSIMASLGKLVSLEVIKLSGCNLGGPLQTIGFIYLKRLRELHLGSNCLNGSIPASLFELPRLEYLDLSYNLLQGHMPIRSSSNISSSLETMPIRSSSNLSSSLETLLPMNATHDSTKSFSGLQGLSQLRYLDLSGNIFIGNDIMGFLGKMVSLEVINLDGSRMGGPLQNIAFENLKKLRALRLRSNRLNGSIPASLFELPRLEYVDLSRNLLQGHVPMRSFLHLPSLQVLKLAENNLNGTFDFFWLRNCTMLTKIDLSGNTNLAIDVNFRGGLPLFQLRSLMLSGCNLDNSITAGPSFLVTQRHLQILDLSNNNLRGSIPNWMFTSEASLVHLDLSKNSLVGSLDHMRWHQSNLQTVNISMNRFDGQLPTNIGLMFPNLTVFDASHNNIYGEVPPSLSNVAGLYVLNLSNNKFTGQMPSRLFYNCSALEVLNLSNNNLGGQIFVGVSSLFAMAVLYLDNNEFEGDLPRNLTGSIEIMDLHDNKLSGKLDVSCWDLRFLKVFSVAGNSLTGEIYPEICMLSNMMILDLSDNNFVGSAPNCNGNLTILQVLNMSRNSLSGFPSVFFSGSSVMVLDLRYNQFTGNLDWIQSLSKINLLLLGGNTFKGQISRNLCSLQYVSIIDLSRNRLSGSLPSCIGGIWFGSNDNLGPWIPHDGFNMDINGVDYMSYVLYDVQGFTFSTKGNLYTYGRSFYNMMFGIDLSANRLSGEIPWEIGNLSHVISLNLSYNFFTSRIPDTFANLSEMESLDLSHNELSGSIPLALTRLSSLEVFSVAYNNLSGCIPDSGQFPTFSMDSYQGNKNLQNMSHGKGCSAGSEVPLLPPSGHHPELPHQGTAAEDVDETPDDTILYVISAVSFVLAFWSTVAFSFCHPYGRSVILKL